MVLDDAAVTEAVVPRRHNGELEPVERRQSGGEGAGVRGGDQHHKRRAGVRERAGRKGGGPHRVLQEILRLTGRRLWR